MTRTRTWLGAVGIAAFLVGLAAIYSPAVAAALPIEGLVAALGGPWVFVGTFGVAAIAIVVAVLLARGVEGIDESTPPDPEDVYGVPHPGAEFDTFVDGMGLRERVFGDRHERTRQRLGMAALTTLERAEGLSRDEAREALARGEWTDDEAAAAFLSGRQTPSTRERLVAAVRGESAFQHGARRAADEIARLRGDAT